MFTNLANTNQLLLNPPFLPVQSSCLYPILTMDLGFGRPLPHPSPGRISPASQESRAAAANPRQALLQRARRGVSTPGEPAN